MIRGAEAEIIREDGVMKKLRAKKGYRNKTLDIVLRKKRTQLEARLMSEARRSGVNVPKILDTEEFAIRMEYISGERLKDAINKRNCVKISSMIAESVAKLHNAGIIHGDLTTSNMLYAEGLYFIDFGLGFRSQRAEDKATDLHLMKESLESTHFDIAEQAWKTILKVYREKS